MRTSQKRCASSKPVRTFEGPIARLGEKSEHGRPAADHSTIKEEDPQMTPISPIFNFHILKNPPPCSIRSNIKQVTTLNS
jgi:hypothetical protein